MTKKISTGLGKGLEALMPSSIEFSDKGFKFKSPDDATPSKGMIANIDISKIVHNPYQPRKDFDRRALDELKTSIIEHGIIQPVTVRKSITGYEIISGERRLRAATEAGYKEIPAYILEVNTDVKMLELALIENVQREDLNPIEVANGYAWLIEEGSLTQEQVAQKVGKDRASIANYLRMLKLPQVVQDSLRDRETTMGHAKALLALQDPFKITKAWNIVQEKQLSVRATEELVRNVELGIIRVDDKHLKPELKQKKRDPKINLPPDIIAIINEKEKALRYKFGTKVRIDPKDEITGSIEIDYTSIDDFERIMGIIMGDS